MATRSRKVARSLQIGADCMVVQPGGRHDHQKLSVREQVPRVDQESRNVAKPGCVHVCGQLEDSSRGAVGVPCTGWGALVLRFNS